MAPGNPGVPGEPVVLYEEAFENRALDSNVLLTAYAGAGGETYTGDPYWVSRPACNGLVINWSSPPVAGDCDGASFYDNLTAVPRALGVAAGSSSPETNGAASSYTEGSSTNNGIQFATVEPLNMAATNRFVTFSVDAGAMNCFASDPLLRFYLVDGTGTEIPVSNSAINPCTDPRASVYTVPRQSGTTAPVSVGRFPADSSILMTGDTLGIVMRNENGSGAGNDGAYDNIRVLDVTPQLDKSFAPAATYTGGTSTLTLTVTNTSDLAEKNGWAFTDTLPDGLVVADPANTGGTCDASVAATGSSIEITDGGLAAGQASCTITVDVTSTEIGEYENCAENFSDVLGLDLPGCARVEFLRRDFGDAPVSYGTEAEAGAFHLVPDHDAEAATAPLTLGTSIDVEDDVVPSSGADSDDIAGTDDEDGVGGPVVVTVGDETTVSVTATNDTDADATIAGWIDLDGSGTFDGGELVMVAAPANSGTADYSLTFPAGSTTTDSFARFRLFPAGVTEFLPTGSAPAGEVEDYPVTVLERDLAIEKSSTMTEGSRPGDTITYTLTASNTGTGDYTEAVPAVVFDDLTAVLDDAEYADDAVAEASDGSEVPAPAFLEPSHLSWAGPIAAGESVEITYTVTLAGGGDGVLRNVGWQPDTTPPSGEVPPTPACDPPTEDGTDPETGEACSETEGNLPRLTVEKSSDVQDLPADRGTVEYTVTVTNDGPGAYTANAPATVTDDLSDVLDDGTFGEIVEPADGAELDEEAQELTWSGPLGVGESVDVVYTVTYDATTGDNILYNVACVPTEETTPGAEDCVNVRLPGAELEITKSVDPEDGSRVVAGQDLTYTVSFASVGEADAAVDVVDDLSDVLDDATLVEGSITTSDPALTAVLDGDQLAVTGSVPVGDTVTVSYTVTVDEYDEQDNHHLANVVGNPDGSCPTGGCPGTENPVRHISVTKSAAPTEGVQAGDTVEYTVTVVNDGGAVYTADDPAVIDDDMTDLLDDATYDGDAVAVASDGSEVPAPTFDAPRLQWSGPLAVGETLTITYTTTVTNLGDHDLVNTAGPVCSDPEVCDPPAEVETLLPRITPAKSSDPDSGEPLEAGQVVTYTLSWTNDGQATGPLDSTDDLSDVLDDGELTSQPVVDEAHAESITAAFDAEAREIRVTGGLAPGETVQVTYQVTVLPDGERGDNVASNVLTPDVTPFVPPADCGDDCPPPFEPPTTRHPMGDLDDWKTVDPASGTTIQPGQVMTYTLHFENAGAAPVEVERDDVLTGVLDDATVTSEPSSPDEAVSASQITDGRFTVSGTLEPGQHATLTYEVTVNEDGARGDDRLGNFLVDNGEQPPTECVVTDPERPDCSVNHVFAVVVSKSSDPDAGTELAEDDEVTYTLTFENVSSDADSEPTAITYTDHMVDVLDDAALTAGPTSSDEEVTAVADGNTIQLTGVVPAGVTTTVTYTVTVKDYDEQGDHALGNVVAWAGEEPVCVADSPLCTAHELSAPDQGTPADPGTPPDDGLASTGAISALVALAALLLLGAGAAMIVISRRREATAVGEGAARDVGIDDLF